MEKEQIKILENLIYPPHDLFDSVFKCLANTYDTSYEYESIVDEFNNIAEDRRKKNLKSLDLLEEELKYNYSILENSLFEKIKIYKQFQLYNNDIDFPVLDWLKYIDIKSNDIYEIYQEENSTIIAQKYTDFIVDLFSLINIFKYGNNVNVVLNEKENNYLYNRMFETFDLIFTTDSLNFLQKKFFKTMEEEKKLNQEQTQELFFDTLLKNSLKNPFLATSSFIFSLLYDRQDYLDKILKNQYKDEYFNAVSIYLEKEKSNSHKIIYDLFKFSDYYLQMRTLKINNNIYKSVVDNNLVLFEKFIYNFKRPQLNKEFTNIFHQILKFNVYKPEEKTYLTSIFEKKLLDMNVLINQENTTTTKNTFKI